MLLLYRNIYHTSVCLPICFFVLSISNIYIYIYIYIYICAYIYIYIYIYNTTQHSQTIWNIFGIDRQESILYSFCFSSLLAFYDKIKCFCCLVFHFVIWVIFLYTFLCCMWKSFDRKKQIQIKGPYIKYVGGETGWFLWGSWNILGTYLWAMKYFLELLMGHKS